MKTKTKRTFTAEEVLMALDPIKGEMRVVYRCVTCGQFIGRRFIPFGLGRGLTINPCWCDIGQREMNAVPILSAKP